MVFNATFNSISDISWWSVLLVVETGIHGENHRPVIIHCYTLSHTVVSNAPRHERFELTTFVVIGTDYTGSCKSNYHMITTTTAPTSIQNKNKGKKNTMEHLFCREKILWIL
jgi:hypothetical protein